MTLKYLAKKFNIPKATLENRASEILLLTELRRIEAEIFSLTEKYGVQSLKAMDKLISSGKLTEEKAGEDFFQLDYLLEKKKEIEEILKSFKEKPNPWAVMTNFKGLLKLNFGK